MSVRRNFEMGWKLDALNDCLCFRWISDQDDGLRALEHRVLFPSQLISWLRPSWHLARYLAQQSRLPILQGQVGRAVSWVFS